MGPIVCALGSDEGFLARCVDQVGTCDIRCRISALGRTVLAPRSARLTLVVTGHALGYGQAVGRPRRESHVARGEVDDDRNRLPRDRCRRGGDGLHRRSCRGFRCRGGGGRPPPLPRRSLERRVPVRVLASAGGVLRRELALTRQRHDRRDRRQRRDVRTRDRSTDLRLLPTGARRAAPSLGTSSVLRHVGLRRRRFG